MFLRANISPARTLAGIALVAALSCLASANRSQAADGPFTGMAGNWSGPGSITVSGARERLRCRANYNVSNSGSTVDMNIRCASDSYKFDLQGGVNYVNGAVTGTWSESAHGAAGTISGTASGGVVRVSAAGPYFSALLSMNTRGNSQSISLTSPGSQISSVTISLSKGSR
jgi:hypothetical protein